MQNSVSALYHQALVNPLELTGAECSFLLQQYPYSQPLQFAMARRAHFNGEQSSLSAQAMFWAKSPSWLNDYIERAVEVAEPAQELELEEAVMTDEYIAFEEYVAEELSTVEHMPLEVMDLQPEDFSSAAAVIAAEEQQEHGLFEKAETVEVEAVASLVIDEDRPVDKQAQQGLEEVVDEHPSAKVLVADGEQALDDLIQGGISGGDYFALMAAGEPEEAKVEVEAVAETLAEAPTEKEDVSLYNDELMPYTFRWWLHKTRLEHAHTYQPFASPTAAKLTGERPLYDTKKIDEVVLDQQIRENIFHLQSPEDKLSEETKKRTVEFAKPTKTTEVIERFILQEPQIQPPPADQLFTENKARKSSEDQFDLVTETLAQIYADQGMYPKAIEVLKKLIVKFPEKKSYFADQITEIEKNLY